MVQARQQPNIKCKDGLVLSSSSLKIRGSWILVWDTGKSIISLRMCRTCLSNLDQRCGFLKNLPTAKFRCCNFTLCLPLHGDCKYSFFPSGRHTRGHVWNSHQALLTQIIFSLIKQRQTWFSIRCFQCVPSEYKQLLLLWMMIHLLMHQSNFMQMYKVLRQVNLSLSLSADPFLHFPSLK